MAEMQKSYRLVKYVLTWKESLKVLTEINMCYMIGYIAKTFERIRYKHLVNTTS